MINGYANELFRNDVAGDDLKRAILLLMNRIKNEQRFPKMFEVCNISSIWKKKKSRNDFENYRGIFRVSIFRSILDKLIYNDEYNTIDSNLTDSNVGARKGRNIRDNIFVLNAIINSVLKGKEDSIDVQLFDVEKCFDSLWVEECINDAFEAGLDNDKLPLLFLENQNANCAVKINNKISKRKSISNIIMQGTVFGSLLCTTTMDQLGKLCYQNENLLYKYKGKVAVPTLGMVDDLLSVTKCTDSVQSNVVTNAFIEWKKLNLGANKCSRIHIGKKTNNCKELKVHTTRMRNSVKEMYLGDYITPLGGTKVTISDRVSKGYGLLSEIKAIIEEIPLGKYRVDIGLKLRQAILINGLLYNSEAWHSITMNDVHQFEKIDNILLRFLLDCPAKTPTEFLFLETGSIPIRFIIASRRINYLHTILSRDKDELTRKVLEAQIESPLSGDFADLVLKDLQMIDLPINLSNIDQYSQLRFKDEVKRKIRIAALKYLRQLQSSHTKTKHLKYETLNIQSYLKSSTFSNKETKLLSLLRSRMHPDFKCNYRESVKNDIFCPLKCNEENEEKFSDTQEHLIHCKKILKDMKFGLNVNSIEYSDIFSNNEPRLKNFVTYYSKLLEKRQSMTENPGFLDPCTDGSVSCAMDVYNVYVC